MMSRWIRLTVDVAQLRPELSPWLWNMRFKRLVLLLSPRPWAHTLSSFVYNSSLQNVLFSKANTWCLLTLSIQISSSGIMLFNSWREHLQHPTPEVFILVSVKLLSPEPIICFDCQGSELAQGGVAVLPGKTGLPLSCWPEGCWDGKPKPCGEISLWRTMFKNEPLQAVYVVLNQHYSHLAGGKTNKAYKLKLKNTLLLLSCCIITSCCQLHHAPNKLHVM